MDRITRYARPHCYDASRGPLSFLDNGQRSRSSPRINVDSITRKACPERPPSDSSTGGVSGSRMRAAQSTDSLTWRRAAALKTRQQVISPRQHQSHAELRTDSAECLIGTVVVDFTDTQIGEAPVFDPPASPLHASTPQRPPALSNGLTQPAEPPSRVRPVVETVAVHGRRLSYSKAAGADRLDSSDLDDLARQIGLLSAASTSPPAAAATAEMERPRSPATPEPAKEEGGRSRKSRMGWLGGLFRRLRHWPESGAAGEAKKQRRRARSLPPSSKGRGQERQSPDCPSTGADSPPVKKAVARAGSTKAARRELCEKPVAGVSRSRTVDNIERARAFPSDEPDLVLPKLDTTRVCDSDSVCEPARNGHAEVEPRTAISQRELSAARMRPHDTAPPPPPPAPSYCNLAILAYGYSAAYPGCELRNGRLAAPPSSPPVATPAREKEEKVPTPPAVKEVSNPAEEKEEEKKPTPREEKNEEIPNPVKKKGEFPTPPEEKKEEIPTPPEEKKEEMPTPPVEKKEEIPTPPEEKKEEIATPPEEKKEEIPTPPEEKKEEVATPVGKEVSRRPVNGVEGRARVTISVEAVEEEERRSSPGVVVRRKKTVSCSEAPDSVPRSSLIMLAVSQASPRPKTEMVDEAVMRCPASNPMSVSQHEDVEGPEEHDGFYFLRLASQVEAEFREKMSAVEKDLDQEGDKMSEEVSGMLRSVLGKATLLLTDKFSQLRGLCQQNISEQVDPACRRSVAVDGFATRNSDLDGYWALVLMQVDDVRRQFCRLDGLRRDAWRLPQPDAAPSARHGPARRRKKAEPSAARPTVSQARLEARRRLEAAKREAAAKMKAKEAQNGGDADLFIFV